MYSALTIANAFIERAKEAGEFLTAMQLQKLVYFAHGWHLAITDKPLIDEQIEAWRYGPVVPSIYQAFLRFGAGPITEVENRDELGAPLFDETTRELLDKIWDVYGGFSAPRLSVMTHRSGTPWDKTVRAAAQKYGGSLPIGTDIPMEEIKKHFLAEWKDLADSPVGAA